MGGEGQLLHFSHLSRNAMNIFSFKFHQQNLQILVDATGPKSFVLVGQEKVSAERSFPCKKWTFPSDHETRCSPIEDLPIANDKKMEN